MLRKRAFNSSVSISTTDLLRTGTLNGRSYLIVPVIACVEGVHNSEFLSYEELTMFEEAWSARPLPIDHPKDSNGEPATAGSPEVMESSVVGILFNPKGRPDIRALAGELWIDIEKAATVPGGSESIERVQSGGQLEVSTAYYCFVDNVPGEWLNPRTNKVEKFTSTQTQVRPDHLALLPFDEGACNWADGCGAPRINNSAESDHTVNSTDMADVTNAASSARRPTFSGTETTSWGSVDKSFGAYASAYQKGNGGGDPPTSVGAASSACKKWIASKTLLGDAGASTTNDLIKFPVVNPSTGKLNKGALNAVLGGRGAQAKVSTEALNSARAEARSLLKSEFGESTSVKNVKNIQIKINGDQLENTLQAAIEANTPAGGTSTELINRLAVAVGIDAARMQTLIDGDMDFVPKGWLEIIASVLDLDQWDLMMAAGNDNMEARYAPDTDEDDTSASAAMNAAEKKSATADTTLTIPQNKTIDEEKPCMKGLKDKVIQILQSLGLKGADMKEDNTQMATNADVKKTKVDALIASKLNQFSEASREWLTSLSDEQLATLEPVAPAVEEVKAVVVAPAEAVAAAAANKEEPKPVVINKDQILAALGIDEATLETIKTVKVDKVAARNAKIAEIKANAKNPYTESELSVFSDAALEKTLEMLTPAGYRVTPGTSRTNNEDHAPEPPKILLAAPGVYGVDYAKQTARNKAMGVN